MADLQQIAYSCIVQALHPHTKSVASVCTGSLVLHPQSTILVLVVLLRLFSRMHILLEGPKRRPEGGEWEPIKIFFRESLAYNPKRAPQALSSRVCKV